MQSCVWKIFLENNYTILYRCLHYLKLLTWCIAYEYLNCRRKSKFLIYSTEHMWSLGCSQYWLQGISLNILCKVPLENATGKQKNNECFSCLAKKVPVISGFRQLDDFAHWQTKENSHIPQRNLKITCVITPVTCAIHLFFGDRAASLIVDVFTVNSSCRRSSIDSGIVSVFFSKTLMLVCL